MTELQAAMKDVSAKRWEMDRVAFKVGSPMKGCKHCGETTVRNAKVVFLNGYNVYRSYKPLVEGWTYKCMECFATDDDCWHNAQGLGTEPILKPKMLETRVDGKPGLGALMSICYPEGQSCSHDLQTTLSIKVESVGAIGTDSWEDEGGALAPPPRTYEGLARYQSFMRVRAPRKQKAAKMMRQVESMRIVPLATLVRKEVR